MHNRRSGVPVNAGPQMNHETAFEETLTMPHGIDYPDFDVEASEPLKDILVTP